MQEAPPDLLLHENVPGFPHNRMAELLGARLDQIHHLLARRPLPDGGIATGHSRRSRVSCHATSKVHAACA